MRNSNSWTYKDKQITELSRTHQQTRSFLDEDEEEDDEQVDYASDDLSFDSYQPRGKLTRVRFSDRSYGNQIGSKQATSENVGTSYGADLISEINRKIKDHFDDVLHAVEGLSARVTQLESRMRQMENSVDDLKVSIEYNHGRTDGKLRETVNMLGEVQGSVKDLRDKQEITETQLRLAKLQMLKSDPQLSKQKSTTQIDSSQEAFSFVPQQSHQLPPNPVACPEQPAALSSDIPLNVHHQTPLQTHVATAPQLPNQIPQNIIPSIPQLESYSPSPTPNLESVNRQFHMTSTQLSQVPPSSVYQPIQSTTPANIPQQYQVTTNQQSLPPPPVLRQPYQPQQYQVTTNQQSQPPPPALCQPHQPSHQLPTIPKPPQPSQLQPPLSSVYFQAHSPSHQPEEVSYFPPQSIQKSSQPTGVLSPPQQFYVGSTQQIHDQPPNRPYLDLPSGYSQATVHPNNNNRYQYESSYGFSSSNVKPLRPAPSPSFPGDGCHSSQLPTAKILPYALPTASIVDNGSASNENENRVPIDDIVEEVVSMGFRRDLVRATVKSLTEKGQPVDLNVVLDKLMNNG